MGLYNVHSSSIIHNKLSQPAGFNKNKQKPFCFFEDVISTNKDGLSFLPHYNWESLMRVYCSNKKMISKKE